jgi:probable phosphoglycerate mutase
VTDGATRLVLLRHGETVYNQEGRWQGAGSDPPLTERGVEQARAAADALEGAPFDALYASDLVRAVETARVVAATLELPVRLEPGLREMDHGAWEGKSGEEVLATWPEELAALEADPWSVARPGGESYRDLAARLWPVLDALADRHPGGRVVAVTHGGPIRLVLSQLTGTPLTRRDRLGVDNGRWFAVERAGGAWRLAETL